jgi:hypothetical protein
MSKIYTRMAKITTERRLEAMNEKREDFEMTKFLMMAVAAMALVTTGAYAQTNDTTAEVNMKTPDITARGERYADYVQRMPNSTVRTTTTRTTYTKTNMGNGQAVMEDGAEIYRPYRTFTRVINQAPVVTRVDSATYSAPDEQISMEQEADMLINKVENGPVVGQIMIVE